ncbi:MAG TPA: ankyrin repeat domain-containing protein [Candidatus Angelobacter sp.]|nr:ankyrin repeat domain-containing protein [Candidatus Angelobacter sp.]
MKNSNGTGNICVYWLYVLIVCLLGCSRTGPVAGAYSGHFVWQAGLKKLSLVHDSGGHPALDLGDRTIRSEVQSMIQEQTSRANVSSAQGVLTVLLVGSSPLLMFLQYFEIDTPDFSELLRYVELQDLNEIKHVIAFEHNQNQRDLPSQRTALFYAAAGRKAKAAQVLLELGSDPNIPDFEGDTPLIAAVTAGSVEVARELILSGANINQANQAGTTPLMRAVELRRLKLLALLLQSGADPNLVSQAGESALKIALVKNDRAAVALLKKLGASK